MALLTRILSRPLAQPAPAPIPDPESGDKQVNLDANGHVAFSSDDADNPKTWSVARRIYITFVGILLAINATFASTAPTGCLPSLSEELNVSIEASNLVTTLFLLGYVAGPLLWGPLSEFYGRRPVFIVTFFCYFAFNFLCAFTPNFAGLLVGRFITGTFASSGVSNAPGMLADIWGPVARGNALALFMGSTFVGPAAGPITSGFLELTEDWRWAFYELIWLSFASFILLLTLPETLPAKALTSKAKRLRRAEIPGYENVRSPEEASDRTLKGIFKVALTRPWRILFDTISFLVAIYISIVYGLVYMLFTIYPIVFQEKRGWNSGVGELPLIGIIVAGFLGGLCIFYWSSREQKSMLRAGINDWRAERRLPLAMVGGTMFPITMFWFAWTGNFNSVPWIVPTIAGVFLLMSIMFIFTSFFNYLVDTYLMYAASAAAANTVCRSFFAAVCPLFVNQMFDTLGVGGAGSLIAGVGCLLAPIPFVFYKYGEAIRKRSKFAPTEPKVPEEPTPTQESAPSENPDSPVATEMSEKQEPSEEPALKE